MASASWHEIEQLFFNGLQASEPERQRLLSEVGDLQVAAAVRQLWADAADAPAGFLHDDAMPVGRYQIHDIVEGRFQLETLLGSGGMSQVFGAIDKRLDRPVALKFLNPQLVTHPKLRGLIEREARAVCRLAGHPNICTVHDLYWDGGTPFLVMERLAGETLAARLTRGPLPVRDAIAIALSMVEGLAFAHARAVIHRDLKPGNVMLTPFGPKLFDFGIAKRVEPATGGERSILAPPGTFVGSAAYTSPEQAEGLTVDARSDIFSVGCVLYEMVTGAKAFDGASPLATLSAVLRAEPRDIRGVNPAVPREYARIVARCLEKDPERRFQRTTDLRDALDRLVRSGVGSQEPPPPTGGEPAAANRTGAAVVVAASEKATDDRITPRVLARGNRHPVPALVSVTYGLMVGLALLVEIAYEWHVFGAWALRVAALTGVASAALSLAALAVLRRRLSQGQPRALATALALYVGWSIALSIAIAPGLPDRPLVHATIQTMTANVGYPKSLLEALALPVLSVVPLHVVCALEAELRRGKAKTVYRMLSSRHQRAAIPGTIVLRPSAAAVVFAIVTIWWMDANARLLESLQAGPYYSLFLELGVLRVASGLLMLFGVLAWYTWTVNDLRHEAQRLVGR